ncbi:Tlg2-vesicle protein [Ceratobasidium sp. 414]|nr:Tlg2-vesicle protein [Ceratobasidium sp. 414]
MATLGSYRSPLNQSFIPEFSRSPTPSFSTPPSYQGRELDHDTVPLTQRSIKRSKSPTPSEEEALKEFEGIFTKMFRKECWKDRSFLIGMTIFVLLITITILIGVFQDKIVTALVPAAEWVRKAPAGWLIPITVITVLSIPPLFGAEIIHLLCGLTYGLWIGFLIVCAGTVIGESITYFMFRSCLRSRAEKMERGEGGYARLGALARVIRDGGFLVALVVRYSAFPTHILAKEVAEGHPSRLDKTMSTVVLVVTIVVTVIAMRWIQFKLKSAALAIIRERRARENAPNELEIQPFDPSTLYGRTATHSKGDMNFGAMTPQPTSPPRGGMAAARPAQIHVGNSVV